MSAQRLNARRTRWLARETGLPVIRAWGHGGYTYDFVTAGHLHGWYDRKTGSWAIEAWKTWHYDTCPGGSDTGEDAMFPGGVPPLTGAEGMAVLAAGEAPAPAR
jgi:hypothetical protein